MLTPDYLLHCTDSLTELLDAYDNAVVSDIARRIVKTGYVTETAKHQIRQAQQMGLLYEDIIREIAQRTTATDSMVRTLFEDAGVETVETDNRLYTAAGLQPTDLRASPAMLQMLQAGYENTLGTMHNLTLTTANTAQQAYISACDLAMLQVQSGAMSYQQAIRAAIQSVASDGTRVLYPSGRTDRIEVGFEEEMGTVTDDAVAAMDDMVATVNSDVSAAYRPQYGDVIHDDHSHSSSVTQTDNTYNIYTQASNAQDAREIAEELARIKDQEDAAKGG